VQDYYSKVVEHLVNYKEHKQRCAVIRIEIDNLIESNRGISYDSVNVQSGGGFHSSTETAVIDREESELAEELQSKECIVAKIENSLEGLDPIEKFVVDKKYMSGRNVKDVNIYTHPRFEWGRNKYYEIKDEAVEKIARILGYIKKGKKKDN
jgi:ArpU family phage transcriptional regulator